MPAIDSLPAEIEVEEGVDAVRYRLPRRPLGGARLAGLILIPFGLAFAGGAIAMMVVAAVFFLPEGGLATVFAAGFILFLTLFASVGFLLLAVGLFILFGRMEIEVKDGRLRAIERAGPFLWTRSRPAEKVRKLTLHEGRATVNGRPVTEGPLSQLGALAAECEGAKPMLVAVAYPKNWLRPLADDLARRCPAAVFSGSSRPQPLEVVEAPPDPDPAVFHERLEQPAGSSVVHEPHADGVTLTVPPAGLRKGSKGVFTFAVMWLVVVAAISAIAVTIGFGGGDPPWLFLVIVPLFWLVGVAVLLGAINMGRRQAVFAVVRDSLLVMQTGLFGGKKREWPRDDIADVRAGPSGMTINDRPVINLQVHLKSGSRQGFLAGREDAELQWMATVLRRALGVPDAADA